MNCFRSLRWLRVSQMFINCGQLHDLVVLIYVGPAFSRSGRPDHRLANPFRLDRVISAPWSQSQEIEPRSNRDSQRLYQPELSPLSDQKAWTKDVDRLERQVGQLQLQLTLGAKVEVLAMRVRAH